MSAGPLASDSLPDRPCWRESGAKGLGGRTRGLRRRTRRGRGSGRGRGGPLGRSAVELECDLAPKLDPLTGKLWGGAFDSSERPDLRPHRNVKTTRGADSHFGLPAMHTGGSAYPAVRQRLADERPGRPWRTSRSGRAGSVPRPEGLVRHGGERVFTPSPPLTRGRSRANDPCRKAVQRRFEAAEYRSAPTRLSGRQTSPARPDSPDEPFRPSALGRFIRASITLIPPFRFRTRTTGSDPWAGAQLQPEDGRIAMRNLLLLGLALLLAQVEAQEQAGPDDARSGPRRGQRRRVPWTLRRRQGAGPRAGAPLRHARYLPLRRFRGLRQPHRNVRPARAGALVRPSGAARSRPDSLCTRSTPTTSGALRPLARIPRQDGRHRRPDPGHDGRRHRRPATGARRAHQRPQSHRQPQQALAPASRQASQQPAAGPDRTPTQAGPRRDRQAPQIQCRPQAPRRDPDLNPRNLRRYRRGLIVHMGRSSAPSPAPSCLPKQSAHETMP